MKKVMNKAVDYGDDVLTGLQMAHPDTFAIGGEIGRMLYKPTPC